MNLKIIYEDEVMLVIDKPSGWVVNAAETAKGQPTVQGWLRRNFKFKISNSKLYRSGIVHRLDKETSGILLVGKTKEAFENLQKQFKERLVKKEYLALVHGEVIPEKGKIEASVGRLPWRRERFGILAGGRQAITKYEMIDNYKQGQVRYTLLSLFPQTGRTHQIRIHLKYLGHSVVADEFYAGRKTARKDRQWCPRLFLHASKIEFTHPKKDKKMKFSSKLPSDLEDALKFLTLKP